MSHADSMASYRAAAELPDYDEPTPPEVIRESTHTARKTHWCEWCEGPIYAGEKYTNLVYQDDDGITHIKAHADKAVCRARRTVSAPPPRVMEEWDEPF